MIVNGAPQAEGEWQLPTVRAAMLLVYHAAWLVLFAGALASTVYFSVRGEVSEQAQYGAGASLGFAR